MTRVGKLWTAMLREQRSMPFRDFERILGAFGFELDRVRGSHHIYVHRQIRRAMSVQPRGSEAKVYQIRQLIELVEQYGLSMEDQP